ncbi:uncharacterized protein LOC111255799 isoform X4 [Setaria italica]|uniref:uncharacterized protein LOC111255799 isoform X4 n=1 Tax=Setaria italica TaxID=4555 RepID=UPI000BE54A57|nr:uncharacterized protein LOC111255799 isoform X4 [Setaria italica]
MPHYTTMMLLLVTWAAFAMKVAAGMWVKQVAPKQTLATSIPSLHQMYLERVKKNSLCLFVNTSSMSHPQFIFCKQYWPAPNDSIGTQTQPSVVAEPYSMPPHGGQAETHASMEADDCDENIIFEEDEEEDERYLFGGQECDDWDADEDVDLETTNEDPNEPDVSDPYDAVYANVLDETHMLKLEDNCEHCNAKKFESEPPGFYCRSGKIHLSTPETPSELVRLWSSSDTDARHFRANIRYFNAHFSFTSLYCKLDRVTTDMKNCGIYTFHAHGQIYHNIRSFGKEDGHEPRHLELYFYDHDPSLEHRLHKCHEKSAQEDREVIQRLKDILHGINHYSENLRSMGQVHNNKVAKQHMELRFCVLACL